MSIIKKTEIDLRPKPKNKEVAAKYLTWHIRNEAYNSFNFISTK